MRSQAATLGKVAILAALLVGTAGAAGAADYSRPAPSLYNTSLAE